MPICCEASRSEKGTYFGHPRNPKGPVFVHNQTPHPHLRLARWAGHTRHLLNVVIVEIVQHQIHGGSVPVLVRLSTLRTSDGDFFRWHCHELISKTKEPRVGYNYPPQLSRWGCLPCPPLPRSGPPGSPVRPCPASLSSFSAVRRSTPKPHQGASH